eukprot:g40677.t1
MQVGGYCGWSVGRVEQMGEKEDGLVRSDQGGQEAGEGWTWEKAVGWRDFEADEVNIEAIGLKGIAIGTRIGPSYACLFVGFMEQALFYNYTSTILHLFLCHIDDCIGAALCSHEELEQFINFANTFHPILKFTWTISDTS